LETEGEIKPMTKIVTIAEMQAIEKAADAAGHSYDDMMQLAGRAVADVVLNWLVDEELLSPPKILVIVGPGNNGGDGLVAAENLLDDLGEDADITAYLLKARSDDEVYKSAKKAGVNIVFQSKDSKAGQLKELVEEATIIIDALFGTGTRLPIEGEAADILQAVHEGLELRRKNRQTSFYSPSVPVANPLRPAVIAVDCPSGLDCDSGELDPLAISADTTVTFAAAKAGQLAFPGAEAVGDLVIADIGLPQLDEYDDIALELADGQWVQNVMPQRSINSHKGTFGKTMIVGGSLNYTGAPYLAGQASYRIGTGLVTIGAPQVIVGTLASLLPDATWLLLPHEMGVLHENAVEILKKESQGYDALLLGPGFGQEDATLRFLKQLLQLEEDAAARKRKRQMGFAYREEDEEEVSEAEKVDLPPLVIDADGLNLLSKIDDWWKLLPKGSILTPHPAEFARLARINDEDAVKQVQNDRVNMARTQAEQWGVTVVLKGAFTVVASPEGEVMVLPFATSALATAGTGDVLAGAIVGLRAQGLDSFDAAVAGAWLHGYAGLVAESLIGTAASVTASDVLAFLPDALVALEEAYT
jgi:NAD(P)H-hydrate epimerase